MNSQKRSSVRVTLNFPYLELSPTLQKDIGGFLRFCTKLHYLNTSCELELFITICYKYIPKYLTWKSTRIGNELSTDKHRSADRWLPITAIVDHGPNLALRRSGCGQQSASSVAILYSIEHSFMTCTVSII